MQSKNKAQIEKYIFLHSPLSLNVIESMYVIRLESRLI